MKKGIGREGFVKVFIIFVIFVGVVFAAMSFGRPYYRYNTLRSHTKDILLTQTTNLQTIREEVMADAAKLHVPLKDEDLQITTNPNQIITVKAKWSEIVDFWGYYQKELFFVMEVEV